MLVGNEILVSSKLVCWLYTRRSNVRVDESNLQRYLSSLMIRGPNSFTVTMNMSESSFALNRQQLLLSFPFFPSHVRLTCSASTRAQSLLPSSNTLHSKLNQFPHTLHSQLPQTSTKAETISNLPSIFSV